MSRSMDKALSLLEFVADGAQTLNDLSVASHLPKSTVHRLVGVLVDHGFLRTVEFRYFLGYRLMELGEVARQQVPLSGLARRHMEEVATRTSETIHLGELTGREIVYLEKVEGARGLQMRSRVGLMSPAAATAMGKVMIAFLPEATWLGYYLEEPPRTPSSITSAERFTDELRLVREQGFAFDREENEIGICCVAAPVWDASGHVVAAVSLSGAVVYIPPDRLSNLAHDVVACAAAISRELGAGVRSSSARSIAG